MRIFNTTMGRLFTIIRSIPPMADIWYCSACGTSNLESADSCQGCGLAK
jgi:hypothetical protein